MSQSNDEIKEAVRELLDAERERQIAKGFDAEHDDAHVHQEIIFHPLWGVLPRLRKWEGNGPMPTYELVRVVAMGIAELERSYRARAK